jgi:hypothetical protein
LLSVCERQSHQRRERERERESEWSALALLVGPGRTSAVLVGDAQVCWVLERGARSAGFQRERERDGRGRVSVSGCRSVERGRFGKWGEILEMNVK